MSPYSAERLRQKKGCDACRSSKKLCDANRPSCGACTKKSRQCSWPMMELSLFDQRRGWGPLKSRVSSWRPHRIEADSPLTNGDIGSGDYSMNPMLTNGPSLGQDDQMQHLVMSYGPPKSREPNRGLSLVQNTGSLPATIENELATFSHSVNLVSTSTSSDPILMIDNEYWPDMGTDSQYASSLNYSSYVEDSLPLITSPSVVVDGFDPFISFSDAQPLPARLGSLFQLLSDHHIPATNSLFLERRDIDALKHYQTTFSTSRTTKKPEWSTHRLLLDLSRNKTMIMYFILAVSINDVSYRQNNEASLEAREYFKTALQDLAEITKDDSPNNYVYSMAGFLFLYLYLPKQRTVPPHAIDQLSMTVRDFVKNHKLDCLCLESSTEICFANTINSTDRNILARLIIWTFDEDVKCGFQGSGGHLAQYLTAHRERTMAVYEVSRVALQAHWGTIYPKDQIDDDDDNAIELEFLWILTALWQDINELTQKSFLDYVESCLRIEQRFSLLQKKYSSVFQNSAIADLPRTRVLMNADYDVVLFNALKIYYFRITVAEIEIEAPSEIQIALKSLLTIVRRTFTTSGNELHDRLQWPLFVAGIETEDGSDSNWILSRISTNRARTALITIIQRQSYLGSRLKRLTIHQIRSLLFEGHTNKEFALSRAGHDSFWDMLAKF